MRLPRSIKFWATASLALATIAGVGVYFGCETSHQQEGVSPQVVGRWGYVPAPNFGVATEGVRRENAEELRALYVGPGNENKPRVLLGDIPALSARDLISMDPTVVEPQVTGGNPPPAAPAAPGSRGPGGSDGERRMPATAAKPGLGRGVPGDAGAAGDDVVRQRARVTGQQVRPVRLPAIPGSLPSIDEEVWVIQRYRNPDSQPRRQGQDDDGPGSGSLVCPQPQPDGTIRPVPVPLKHTEVHAAVAGHIASVEVTQQYHNPFSSKIEAVYVFPLPENAAVSDFVMTIGDRRIRGIIRDRAEAEQIYQQARAQGHVASLMTQERPNIFTQKVANIEPGKSIDIAITYFNTLQYIDGEFEFVLPMVVGPRFNPPGFYDGVGAAQRNQPGSTGQATEVQYLRPNERSGHDIAVTLDIDAGVPLGRVYSNSHVVEVRRPSFPAAANEPAILPPQSHRATVTLSATDRIPNKDLVVRWQVAGQQVRSGGVVCSDPSGDQFFNVLLVPPQEIASLRRQPVEMIFVLDCSGSMNGRPIEQAVAAAERGLRRLEVGDTFQIINFSNSASQMGATPVPVTAENVQRGVDYLRGLFAQGGTMMINGIRASLGFPHDPQRLRYVVFLTDGYIGNEQEILSAIHAGLGDSRIFSFGVGTSTNRYLLDAMAKAGRGCVAHVAAGDNPVEIIDRFFDRVSHPAMTDVTVEVVGASGAEILPGRVPDLYVGRIVAVSGRIPSGSLGTGQEVQVIVRGVVEGRRQQLVVNLDRTEGARVGAGAGALSRIWARCKIADMADHASYATLAQFGEQVKGTALRYGLLSAYTAFVAVDSSSYTEGTHGTTVVMPVPVPDGVRYETTVPESTQSPRPTPGQ